MSFYISLHLLSAVIWVGGMFFAYMVLRPAAATLLEPPQRLPLWSLCFKKFFVWVWLAIIVLLSTGYLILFTKYGSFSKAPIYVHLMHGLGLLMMLIFMHVFFAAYKRLKIAVTESNWAQAAKKLAQIRWLIAINTGLGLAILIIVNFGRHS